MLDVKTILTIIPIFGWSGGDGGQGHCDTKSTNMWRGDLYVYSRSLDASWNFLHVFIVKIWRRDSNIWAQLIGLETNHLESK